MRCSECRQTIPDGVPMVLANIGVYPGGDRDIVEDFTGVVWHVECAPGERKQFRLDAERIMEIVTRPNMRAKASCDVCHGKGTRVSTEGADIPCDCPASGRGSTGAGAGAGDGGGR